MTLSLDFKFETIMQPACKFPERVTVRANDLRADGLAVRLCFEMNHKNDFYYPLFLGPCGIAEVAAEELLAFFDDELAIALMDYVNPRGGFTGRVTAIVMTDSDLRGALEGYRRYRAYTTFPKDYEANLIAALERGQNPDEFHLELELD